MGKGDNMSLQRNEKFDFYKGMLMLGVIWGHIITALRADYPEPSWLLTFFRTYDMPMFAFITGFFLKKSVEKHSALYNILNKIGNILIPAAIWEFLINLGMFKLSLSVGKLWFLWSIFICCAVIIGIDFLFKSHPRVKSIVMVLAVLIFHLKIGNFFKAGFLLLPCAAGFYYQTFSNAVKRKIDKNGQFYLKTLLVIIIIIMQCFWTTDYNVWNTPCNILEGGFDKMVVIGVIYRDIIGLIGCVVMKMAFDVLYDITSSSAYKQVTRANELCSQIGQNTIEMYILHVPLVSVYGVKVIKIIVEKIGFNPFAYNMDILNLILSPVITIIVIAVVFFIKKLLCKIPFVNRIIFGIPLSKYLKINKK